ncbi:LysM peptidoglycan-binding domain-containing protein [Paratractidigestivibacter sp.]|uniref:cell division suppressor protein YneA n=1 Tax=Paratractidigestivibacter sp. TaxID=2847316 RepID=UPI002AC9270F|nr:LysM peptidoglycan-binding domain-containing protein [Paratractidigestivibacter sp.]
MTTCRNTLMLATDGSSALAPEEHPVLVLIEGGKGAATSGDDAKKAISNRTNSLFACAMAVVFAVVLATLAFGVESSIAASESLTLNEAATTNVRVMSGDSLWSIASQHGVDGCSTQSIVDWIRDRNQLESSNIFAGQELIVPTSANL